MADYSRVKMAQQSQVSEKAISQLSWVSENVVMVGESGGEMKLKDVRKKGGSCLEVSAAHSESVIRLAVQDLLVASGSHDKSFSLVDLRKTVPIWQNRVEGAVYGLEWSPHKMSTLISGVGNKLTSWNVVNQKCVWEQTMDSDILGVRFSQNVNEFVTGHGFKRNMIGVWRGEDGRKITLLEGHRGKVTMLDLSPEGQTLVSGGGDEVLKFWSVFPGRSGLQREMSCEIR